MKGTDRPGRFVFLACLASFAPLETFDLQFQSAGHRRSGTSNSVARCRTTENHHTEHWRYHHRAGSRPTLSIDRNADFGE